MSKARVIEIGNRAGCGYCKKLAVLADSQAFEEGACGFDYTVVDKADGATFAAAVKKYGVKLYPTLAVLDKDGKLKGTFVGRPYSKKTCPQGFAPFTAAGLLAKIKALCPSCADGECADAVKTCPTCGGTGKVLASLALAALTWLGAGCAMTGTTAPQSAAVDTPTQTTPATVNDGVTRRAVVWGLDHVNPAAYGGSWNGECPGTILDALRMKALLESRGYAVTLLTNEQATAYRVTAACVAACAGMKEVDRFVAYGSSHGGQVADVNGDEAGGKDSTICLWDGQFTDDLVGEMLQRVKAKIDVDLMLDCCNSGTMMRGPHDYVRVFRARQQARGFEIKCNLTYRGGCGDGKSSYGGDDGGRFTNALLAKFKDGITKDEWNAGIASAMPRNQVPVFSYFGPDASVLGKKEALK